MGYGICGCTMGPPPFGVCAGCGALGAGATPNLPVVVPPAQGWTCPRCQSVYSPGTSECVRCNSGGGLGTRLTSTTTTTISGEAGS